MSARCSVVHVRLGERTVVGAAAAASISIPTTWSRVVAVFGTTISPYLFFWQAARGGGGHALEPRLHAAAQPCERGPGRRCCASASTPLSAWAFPIAIAFFIMLTTAATLHARGIIDIETSAQAAEALRPLAGELTFFLFAAGIIGTGLLAVPVLAGSAAYGVAEAFGWRSGLELTPREARGFYSIIAGSTLIGALIELHASRSDQALFWTAVINGVIAVPVMAVMMAARLQPRGDGVGRREPWLPGGRMGGDGGDGAGRAGDARDLGGELTSKVPTRSRPGPSCRRTPCESRLPCGCDR